MSALSTSGARKKQRARSEPEDGRDGRIADSLNEKDLHELRIYLQGEETALRAEAKQKLNRELIDLIEACKKLVEKAVAQDSFSAALEAGVVSQVRKQLSACYRLGVCLESWLNTYQPPLSAGGNVGVSAEVQDGIYQNVHAMTVGSSDALHRMLAFEKEHAQMRTKCTDEAVWQRYKSVLEDNQMHDVCKAAMEMQSELMLIGNSLLNNLAHLRADLKEEKLITAMY